MLLIREKYNIIRKGVKGIFYDYPISGDYVCGKGYCEVKHGIVIFGRISL